MGRGEWLLVDCPPCTTSPTRPVCIAFDIVKCPHSPSLSPRAPIGVDSIRSRQDKALSVDVKYPMVNECQNRIANTLKMGREFNSRSRGIRRLVKVYGKILKYIYYLSGYRKRVTNKLSINSQGLRCRQPDSIGRRRLA